MARVTPKTGESFDTMLNRFKRKVENQGIIKQIKSHQEYLKPSVKKNLKRKENLKLRVK